jgi:phage gpG-like protein
MQVKVTGIPELRAKLAGIGERIKDLKPAYLRAATVVLTAAQMRIRSKGDGDWAPEATGKDGKGNPMGSLLNRTGRLMRSLTINADGNVFKEIPGGMRVGTNIRTDDDRYSIGEIQQYGTGPILPKKGKFLVFEVNGVKIFSKGTKGIPARPFLYIDDEDADRVKNVFSTYVMKGETE